MSRGTEKFVFALVLAAGGVAPSGAAEWSLAPEFSWLADHASNRSLRPDGPRTGSLGAIVDLNLARRSETSEFLIRPHYRLQRFEKHLYPDVDDQSLMASARWRLENSKVEITAQAAQESTLTTELAETGLVRADSNRHTIAGEFGWQFEATETRQYEVSLSWQDVDYTGANQEVLTGYRYATASLGESFALSPRWGLQVSAFGSRLENPERGGTNDEQGLSLGASFAWSERTQMSLSFGVSRQDAEGRRKSGTTRDFSLSHQDELLDWGVTYSHRLQPYGTGVLAERDSAQLQLVRVFSPQFSLVVRAGHVSTRDAGFGLTFDRRDYSSGETELRWQWRESWAISVSSAYARAQQDPTVFVPAEEADGWNVALRTYWTPRAYRIGR